MSVFILKFLFCKIKCLVWWKVVIKFVIFLKCPERNKSATTASSTTTAAEKRSADAGEQKTSADTGEDLTSGGDGQEKNLEVCKCFIKINKDWKIVYLRIFCT